MTSSDPDSLDRDITRAGDLRDADKSPSTLGDLSTNADLAASLSDLGGLDDGIEDAGEIADLAKRYEIAGTLGRGGMGEVVRARDRRLDRGVAIKRLRSEFGSSQKAFRRFLTEAKSVAALNHYNIVQIYDFGQDADGPFIVMELVEGQSLAERLEAGPIPLDEAIEVAAQISEALQMAHDRGVVHRDIKPANILLNENGVPKLTDFGLARQETAEQSTHTQAGTVLGTLDFMPPEQRTDASTADARSDQWSLAATFYQMVTGEVPRVIDGGVIPESVREVTLQGLKTKPDDRFESTREFGQQLQAATSPASTTGADPLALAEGQCAACGASNEPSRKFCKGCGATLLCPCSKCEQPTAIWERFCGLCGLDIRERLTLQLVAARALRGQVQSLRTSYRHQDALTELLPLISAEHPALGEFREWATKTHQVLETELAKLTEQRDALTTAAQEQLDLGRFTAAQKHLDQVPDPLHSDETRRVIGEVSIRGEEAKTLGAEIQAGIKQRSYDGLDATVERYLELKPNDAAAQKLQVKLQKRKARKQQEAASPPVDPDEDFSGVEPIRNRNRKRRRSGGSDVWKSKPVVIGGCLAAVLLIAVTVLRPAGSPDGITAPQTSGSSGPGPTQDADAIGVVEPATTRIVTLDDQSDWNDWRCQLASGVAGGEEGGWRLDDGVLSTTDLPDHGLLWTASEFGDFELSLEYRLTPGSNSGILFRGTGEAGTWGRAFLEVQLLDDEGFKPIQPGVSLGPEQRNGSLYGIIAPRQSADRPAGEWNTLEIHSVGSQLNVTLNGVSIIDADLLESPAAKQLAAERPAILRRSGLIGFQKHRGNVDFRNIRIREPSPSVARSGIVNASTETVSLFDGTDLNEWTRSYDASQAFSVKPDGTLHCRGNPNAILWTKDDYEDFELSFDFRFPTDGLTSPPGSGVIVRAGREAQLRDMIEVQLRRPSQNDASGDFWLGRDAVLETAPERISPQFPLLHRRIRAAVDRSSGFWNSIVIRCDGSDVRVVLNNAIVNSGQNANRTVAPIGLRSQGTAIDFRNIELRRLNRKGADTQNDIPSRGDDKWIVGDWQIDWSVNTGDSSGETRYRFTESGDVYKDIRQMGSWRADAGSILVTFDDAARGTVRIQKQDLNHLSAVHNWQNGTTARWAGTRTNPLSEATDKVVPAIPDDAVAFGGSRYKFILREMTWQKASQYCQSQGGHLPVVTSQVEHDFLTAFLNSKAPNVTGFEAIWLGATDSRQEGVWEWMDGSRVTFNVWGTGQPNNKKNGEHYAVLWKGGRLVEKTGYWADQPNKSDQHTVYCVCEWSDVSTMSPGINGWRNLFNGSDLTGWRGDTGYWSASGGNLVGRAPGNLPRGQFLILDQAVGDFELQFQFLLKEGNSGVQIHSTDWGSDGVKGHQADIVYGDFRLLGCLMSERAGSSRVAMTEPAQQNRLRQKVDQAGWNDMTIKAVGTHVTITVNDETTVAASVTDMPRSGVLALQLHGGAATEIRFRQMRLRELAP